MTKYFFRLDDISPNMNRDNFNLAVEIFRRHNIKPLIAVIPDVKDPKLTGYQTDQGFWLIMEELKNDGWVIAQHGYRHLSNGNGGVVKIHRSGEFGGLDFENQSEMISAGRKIMEERCIASDIFVAPRHSFDKDTAKALRQNGFSFISDGIALWPFKKWDLTWLPQILWRPRKGIFGMITVALHTNTMTLDDFKNIENFIIKNRHKIGDFGELMNWYKNAGPLKKILTIFISWPFRIFWRTIFLFKHGISR